MNTALAYFSVPYYDHSIYDVQDFYQDIVMHYDVSQIINGKKSRENLDFWTENTLIASSFRLDELKKLIKDCYSYSFYNNKIYIEFNIPNTVRIVTNKKITKYNFSYLLGDDWIDYEHDPIIVSWFIDQLIN